MKEEKAYSSGKRAVASNEMLTKTADRACAYDAQEKLGREESVPLNVRQFSASDRR